MTIVRRWGVQFGDGWWFEARNISVETLDMATLRAFPLDAAMDARSVRTELNPTVREVLVTQEAGRWWPVCCVGANVQETPGADGYVIAVKHSPDGDWHYTNTASTSSPDKSRAVVYRNKVGALAALVEYRERNPVGGYHGCPVEVHAVHCTEPREVRVAGRTLDEILASVPVEVPSDE